jgi:hypothetical protein
MCRIARLVAIRTRHPPAGMGKSRRPLSIDVYLQHTAALSNFLGGLVWKI